MQTNKTVEDHFSRLEDQAGRDLYDPSKLTVPQNKEFLDNLIIKAKEKAKSNDYDEAYIGFRRFQILINIIQQRGLFNNNSEEIIFYNEKCRQISSITDVLRNYIKNRFEHSESCCQSAVYTSQNPSLEQSETRSNCLTSNCVTTTVTPPCISATSFLQSNGQELLNSLEYIVKNLDRIPDVRNHPMHVGLPIPENDLDSLLRYDSNM